MSKVPEDVLLSRVAGLPLSGLTAYQALFTGRGSSTKGDPLGSVTKGSKVLVLGGNRGPGHLAVQMAHRKGAMVATTVPPSCIHWMVYIGANRVINFREKDWTEHFKGQDFDLILDCVGWATTLEEIDRAAEVLCAGGQYISISNFECFDALGESTERNGRFFKAMVAKADSEDLDALVSWIAYGDLDVFVDQLCPLAEVRHALRESVSGQCRGKVLLCQCSTAKAVPHHFRPRVAAGSRVSSSTMRAWQCFSWEPDFSQAVKGLVCADSSPLPAPSQGQALVRVHFAAADPWDAHLLTGTHSNVLPAPAFPFVPGFDAAGEVVELGSGCSKLEVGDKVVLCLGLRESLCKEADFGPAGAFAEYCVCPERQMSKVPEDVLLSRVAGLPLSGLTAYQALFTGRGSSTKGDPLGSVTKGSKVLVLGGNRGPGHLAVQMACRKGAVVTTTVPPSCIGWMLDLGASRAINFREEDWAALLTGQDFDLILDCVGWAACAKEMDRATDVLRPGGRYISTSNFKVFEALGSSSESRGRYFQALIPKVDVQDLDALVGMVAAGDLDVVTDQVCPFSEVRHALRESVAGQCRGKVLVCQCGAAPATSRARGVPYGVSVPTAAAPQLCTSTMKAWRCHSLDPFMAPAVNSLKFEDHVPMPPLGHGQVLVRVRFSAADPADVQLVTGAYSNVFNIRTFPFVPGFDAAGEVAALGPDCAKFQVGDKVVLCLGLLESCAQDAPFGPAGAFAEYCVCPEQQVSLVPSDVMLSEVAGLPLAGLTAYQALFTGKGCSTSGQPLGNVQKGSKVLVLGGNRGSGHLAVQMALRAGADVTTTVPPSSVDWMCDLGAQRVINFRDTDWVEELSGQGLDLILDCVGWATDHEEIDRAADVLRPGGQYISISNFKAFDDLGASGERKGRLFKAMIPKADAADLDSLVAWVDASYLEVVTDQVCGFAEVHHALRESVAGQCRGKVLIHQCCASHHRHQPCATSCQDLPRSGHMPLPHGEQGAAGGA